MWSFALVVGVEVWWRGGQNAGVPRFARNDTGLDGLGWGAPCGLGGALVGGTGRDAGPSTSLRFAQDDTFRILFEF